MPHRSFFSVCSALVVCAALAAFGVSPLTQRANAQAVSQPTAEQLLTDFIHYVKIDQKELALSHARAILNRGLTPVEFMGLVEDSPQLMDRFDDAVRQAMRDAALEEVAAALYRLYNQGRLERARDPNEISRNIALLGETQRARMLARERLSFASEYAVPQLLEALTRAGQPGIQAEAQELLVRMGGNAVAPLSAALLRAEPSVQQRLARVLGRIGYAEAVPFLTEVARSTPSVDTRRAAVEAINAIDPKADARAPLGGLYVALGDKYFSRSSSLTRFPGEEHQLVWTFEPGIGLFATPVRTEVFGDVMAMRFAEHAMRVDPTVRGATSLWIGANFSRELNQPADYDNPFYPATRRGAMYYAVAAGEGPVDRVLARALADRNTALARVAIEAISTIAGSAASWNGSIEERALISALAYPDRRVRFEAALALAQSHASSPYPGSERVVPILAGAIRDGDDRFALVVAPHIERQQALMSALQSLGYIVLPPSATLNGALDNAVEAPGIDVVVAEFDTARSAMTLVEQTRATPRVSATPVLVLVPGAGYSEVAAKHDGDALTRALRTGVDDAHFGAAIGALVTRAAGPTLDAAQVEVYSLAALRTLRDLAVSASAVYPVQDALRPLLAALERTTGQVRLDLADVLSHIADAGAQNAVADAALKATGDDQIELLRRVADSARRHGNLLEERYVRRVIELTMSQDDALATAAAAVVGALRLPEQRLSEMILNG